MTRKTEFRAWDKERKKMCYDSTYDEDSWLIDSLSAINYSLEREEYDFMQFTGLLDINGKKIFEGDILKIRGARIKCGEILEFEEVVKYEADQELGYAGFTPFASSDLQEALSRWEWFNAEVIGNIYQNPELENNKK